MKLRLPLLAILLALAAPALAQTPTPTKTPIPTSISWTMNQGRANRYDRLRRALNKDTCLRCQRNAGCTQVQARNTAGCETVDVYNSVSDFLDRGVSAWWLDSQRRLELEADARDFADAFGTTSGANRTQIWALLNLEDGTFPAPTPTPTRTPTP